MHMLFVFLGWGIRNFHVAHICSLGNGSLESVPLGYLKLRLLLLLLLLFIRIIQQKPLDLGPLYFFPLSHFN